MFSKSAFIKNAKAFLKSSSIVIGGIAGYLYYSSYSNKKKYIDSLNDDSAKDMTRIGYEYYGINWGFKADSMIKDKIDTGDLVFLKYECGECITFPSMVKCYYKEFVQSDFEYDSVGIAFRDQNGLFIIFEHFGELAKMNYAEFLSQPHFKEISLRRLVLPTDTKEVSKQFFRSSKHFFDQLFGTEYTKKLDMPPEKFLKEFFVTTTLAHKGDQEDVPPLADYDRAQPTILNPLIKFDSKIIIRSKPNPNLVA